MITRMTKYSFVLLSKDTPGFLNQIQDLGMVDINREEKAVDTASKEMADRIAAYTQCLSKLKELNAPVETYTGTAHALFEEATALFAKQDNLKVEIDSLAEGLAAATPWGNFTKEDLEKINEMGMTLHAYIVPTKRVDPQWSTLYPLQVMNEENGNTYFVVMETPDNQPYAFPVSETPFPTLPAEVLTERWQSKVQELEQVQQRLTLLAGYYPALKAECDAVHSKLDLYLANAGSRKEAEGHLDILTGFIPKDRKITFDSFLEKECIYYESAAACEEDNPPIKLKNNWFARLYEPIGNLYMLPTYNELDLTPYFAPFYMLFFGLCLGDMGYGLIFMALGIAGRFIVPKMKGYLNLVFLLGLGTVLMGALTGVVFGTKIADWWPAVNNQHVLFRMTDMNMFWFAILFGLFQIVFARILRGIDLCIRKGWQHGLSSFGWAILIVWCTIAYASTSIPSLAMPKNVSLALVILSVILILFFSKPEGPIYKRVGPGLWAMYDITGVFGDMLSYIRLFGLGTSGGILGMVMNKIAFSLSGVPYVGWLFTLIILLFGHSLVLALSSLGAFVHPLRLTFVEFYKNVGFTGGGRQYRPLKNNK